MFEVLLLPVVNAVNFLILGEMLFILARAPFLVAFLVLVVYLIVHFISFFFTALSDTLSFALDSSFSFIFAHCNSTQDGLRFWSGIFRRSATLVYSKQSSVCCEMLEAELTIFQSVFCKSSR